MNDFISLLIGALLAIIGGSLGDEIRAWRQSVREWDSIKTTIGDELTEIEGTITNLHNVWTQASILSSEYINDLLNSTSAYDNLRIRMFVCKNNELRKDITAFYKKLKDTARKSLDVVTLDASAGATAKQAKVDDDFQRLSEAAKKLRENLEDA